MRPGGLAPIGTSFPGGETTCRRPFLDKAVGVLHSLLLDHRRSDETESMNRKQQTISNEQATIRHQAGGLVAISRGLSEATPPERG